MQQVFSPDAPNPVGPYSQAIKAGNFLYLSGQIGIDPKTNALVQGIVQQTHQVCKNIQAVLKAAGYDLQDVIKTTIYLKNIEDFKLVNQIYAEYFSHKPARSTVEVANLPLGALVEIEVIAFKN